ncbi:MAG: hypothetical protein AAFU77_16975 [Myxococcota bacterium]
MDQVGLVEALETLGELLEDEGESHDLAVIGGGALLLIGEISRPTKDLDADALHRDGTLTTAHPLPSRLQKAVADVGLALGLGPKWLNGGPTDLLRQELPRGFLGRAHTQTYGALKLRLASRYDQVHFKLYAAVDQGPNSKHTADLMKLKPSHAELDAAAAWCKTHDSSPGFAEIFEQALVTLKG